MLILSTFFNVINCFCKQLLNHSYIAKIYEQRIFFEYIFVGETHRDVEIGFSRLKICKQFIRISKFFIINIFLNNRSNRYNVESNVYHRNVEHNFIEKYKIDISRIDRNFFTFISKFIFCKIKNSNNFVKVTKN